MAYNMIVAGMGRAGGWADGASLLEPDDGKLWAMAHEGEVLHELWRAGGCERPTKEGACLLDDAWVSVASVDDISDLDRDPSVVSWCYRVDAVTTAMLISVLSTAARAGDTWDAPGTAEARWMTAAMGMTWDFTSWPEALLDARRGRFAGFDLTGNEPVPLRRIESPA